MDEKAPNYHREFIKSPLHATLGLLTVGLGFMTGALFPLIIGGTLYALGWIHLPDSQMFRGWLDKRLQSARREEEHRKLTEFVRRRDTLIASLSPSLRERYNRLSEVCRDIESAGVENPLATHGNPTDPRLRKLDELMWTFLRLLGIEESLARFLETERRDNLPSLIPEAESEIARLAAEIETLKKQTPPPPLDAKHRYLASRKERFEVLRKRQQRIEQAHSNLALIVSEQERLDQQIKLIRADAVATKNAEALTARIDATVEHLDQTNKWLSEFDEFKDLVGDMPPTEQRVGYEPSKPPHLVQVDQKPRAREMARQK